MTTARPLNPILGGRRLWPKLELHRLNMSGSVGVVAYLLNLRCGRDVVVLAAGSRSISHLAASMTVPVAPGWSG